MIKRYTPNPHLIAPSTEQRMILAADGEFISHDEFVSLQSVAASMRQIIDRQTKLIEDARYLIEEWHRGADQSEYARDRWEWLNDLDPKRIKAEI